MILCKKIVITILTLLSTYAFAMENITILNVSYDPTRELYREINSAFIDHWKKSTRQEIIIQQSHAGSGKQARAVIDGLQADVVTLALAYDIDAIAEKSIIAKDWQKRLPHNSSPFTSTIVFLVRKGNPKKIHDWNDLVKNGIEIITPNPKTSGGARWNYLAAWAYAQKKLKMNETEAKVFMKKLFANVKVLDSGARGSTTTFVERGIGDVLIAWENEAYLALQEQKKKDFEIVIPSLSILAEPPVSIVDRVTNKTKNQKVATAYLEFLYTKEAQEIAAKNFYRPSNKDIFHKFKNTFPQIDLVTIDKDFGGWQTAQKKHFSDGAIFDQIQMK